ncbi:DUF2290 domain-containing protein [Chitinimonas koreensis]|uniref:DUF2290 domain-containing protein n=1 Tax=Chitinimonas koreensis TaxID=356302 RepID=UPI000A018C4A|nr:DUF2290 domain-containing protein [Chitinimonas koreensis]QNM95773.1 DUF2290 domain-containing protein [Chitinimonas koreensis]
MTPQDIRQQLNDVYARLISTNLSVKQFYPKEQLLPGGGVSIGNLPVSSISLRDISYEEIYTEVESNDGYHIKLPDGGLLIFQYTFNGTTTLTKHRLCYFPSFELPIYDKAPNLYENDELYGDVILNKLVRFPIRFDYDPNAHKDVEHPISHLTLGQYDNCRIPVGAAVSPNEFAMFILRNFYSRSYKKNKNALDKKPHHIPQIQTITEAERRITHFINGR